MVEVNPLVYTLQIYLRAYILTFKHLHQVYSVTIVNGIEHVHIRIE